MSIANSAAIDFSGVSCTYKRGIEPALEDITLRLELGTTVALVGPNGAGKSTLMKAIYGAVETTTGEIRILGKKLTEHSEPYKVIGFTSDENIYPAKSRVKDLFAFEFAAQGLDPSLKDEIKADFGIAKYWKSRLGKLSTGQRQRVLIGLATLSDPPILLLDEPANGLDIESITWLHALIRRREEDGKLTLVSSHNLAELQELASEVENIGNLRAQYLEIVGGDK